MLDVGRLHDFAERSITIVIVGRHQREIGILRWNCDSVYALHNRCPHHGGPLCEGTVVPTLASLADAWGIAVDQDRPVIVCPWHLWEFSAATGACLTDGRMRARTFKTLIADDRVYVDLPETVRFPE